MELLKAISFVKRGKNRKLVFLALEKPMMPSELVVKVYGKSSNTSFNIVSRALGELKKKRIVKILNPKEKTGRIYKRTKLGEKVYKELKK